MLLGGSKNSENIAPIAETAWQRADAHFELSDGTRTAIWAPGNIALHGVAQSERPTASGNISKDSIFNNLLICARMVNLSPVGGLLARLDVQAWSEMQDGIQLARMHYPAGQTLASGISTINRDLSEERRIMGVAPQPGGFFAPEVTISCLAEEEPRLPISVGDPELEVHDIALHVTACSGLSRSARQAGRGRARAVLAGEVEFQPHLPGGKTATAQVNHQLDTNINALLINEESLVPPKFSGRFAGRGTSMLTMAFTNGYGVDRTVAEQLRQDTWEQAAYLQQVFGR